MYAAESAGKALQMASASSWVRLGKWRIIKIEELSDITVQGAIEPEELQLIITALKFTGGFANENDCGEQTQKFRDLYTKLENE